MMYHESRLLFLGTTLLNIWERAHITAKRVLNFIPFEYFKTYYQR